MEDPYGLNYAKAYGVLRGSMLVLEAWTTDPKALNIIKISLAHAEYTKDTGLTNWKEAEIDGSKPAAK